MSLSAENSMPVPPAFHQLLHSYSADQIIAMVHSAARVNGQSGTTETKVTKHSLIAHPKKKTAAVAAASKATRPLNSWIAFRSYYSPMFTSVPQKEISGFLTYLWQTDPFKAKWSILAKAYSLIRDSKGKEKAPLDSYLATNGPFIGIIPPENYLEMLGWKIVAGNDGERLLRRDFEVDVSSLDQDLLTSNVSVNDIIEYSYASGYIAADEANLIVPDNEPVMTMATSVQLNLPTKSAYSAPVNMAISDASGPTTAVTMADANDAFEQNLSRALRAEAEKDGIGSEHQDEEPMEGSSNDDDDNGIAHADYEATEETPSLNEMDTNTLDSMDTYSSFVTEAVLDDSEVGANTQTALTPQVSIPTGQVLGQAGQATVSNHTPPTFDIDMTLLPAVNLLNNNAFAFAEDDHYPFNSLFSPENNVLEFDPFMGDSFNAYDLSDYFGILSYPYLG